MPNTVDGRCDLADALSETARVVSERLETALPPPEGENARLHEAIRYGMLGGGKRVRPFLLRHSASVAGADDENALHAALALEMIHGYSLIHDDLPAMDDDALRRGRPTCHLAFDEATAILAGDSLLTLAFEWLADPRTHANPSVRCEMISGLALVAGSIGMVGGQAIDIAAETMTSVRPGLVTTLAQMKTAALIAFSCEAGAILAESSPETRRALREFGADTGLAFQITDDLLDAIGDEHALGKAVGKDAGRGKSTFVSVLGIDGARQRADDLIDRAIAKLEPFGSRADMLRKVARYVITRTG